MNQSCITALENTHLEIDGISWTISYVKTDGNDCHRKSYGEIECIKCGGYAYSHVYDAAHSPWPIYGYEYHCHSCGIFFEKTSELNEQAAYIKALRDGVPFAEALEVRGDSEASDNE